LVSQISGNFFGCGGRFIRFACDATVSAISDRHTGP